MNQSNTGHRAGAASQLRPQQPLSNQVLVKVTDGESARKHKWEV